MSAKKHIFLSGISGTGMTAVANLLVQKGFIVSGSDNRFYPPTGDFLKNLPVTLYKGFSEKNIIKAAPDMVIIGNALSRGNPEVEYILNRKTPYLSMSGALKKYFMSDTINIVITGTHGKTSTTAILSTVFNSSTHSASFMVGGIPINFSAPSQYKKSKYFIIEGDEYDSAFFEKFPKFLNYAPDILIINNLEFDHADIYDSLQEIKKQFIYLLRLVPTEGLIIANGDDANVREICQHAYSPVIYYGKSKKNEYRFSFAEQNHNSILQIFRHDSQAASVKVPFPLEGTGYNMTAAYIAATNAGLEPRTISTGLNDFKGVKRRLEKIYSDANYTVYDDFAHHPTAVKITLEAVKKSFPQQPLIAVFEPRSNTSIRNIFTEEYAAALSAADYVYLAPAFRKKSMSENDYLDVKKIVSHLKNKGKIAFTGMRHEELWEHLKDSLPPKAVIVMMSNGSFEPLKSTFLAYLKG